MTLKQKIHFQYQNLLDEKLKTFQTMISDLTEDAKNDAKGSAGDKHETALAMMHLEQEKLNQKVKEIIAQRNVLDSIDATSPNHKIAVGSLVHTNNFIFYISTALPKIKIDNKEIIALSIQSPLGEVMKGKNELDEFVFNKTNYKILLVE